MGDSGFGGVRGNRKVGVMGVNMRSKMESGEAGRIGEAMGNRALGLGGGGGERNGFRGDAGDNGDVSASGVSGSQYERDGTGGASRSIITALIMDAVPA
jgi:hypothetical protein